MTDASPHTRPHAIMWLVWSLLFVGLPIAVAGWESRPRPPGASTRFDAVTAARLRRPRTPPPAVEPVENYTLDRDQARNFNDSIPFSRDPNPAARPYVFAGSETDLARATDCLAAAELYEAGDDAVGEKAVAQVVLNRVRHPAFPKSICGVVFQGQERATGCQFTFTCDGALARTPGQAAWERARDIARGALAGKVYKPVGHATHYHTDWVVPYWSGSLDKISAVGTHLFFRWRGWWGTPPAFRKRAEGGEPLVPKIARLSTAHLEDNAPSAEGAPVLVAGLGAVALAAQPQQAIDAGSLGKTVGGVRLTVLGPDGKSFMVELPRTGTPDSWPAMAQTFCAGRSECRIMAWRAGSAPSKLPLGDGEIESMSFAYIHNAGSGLQRALWNCAQTPRAIQSQCMRQRVPTVMVPPAVTPGDSGLAGIRRKERFETVKIGPPDTAPKPGSP
ncbi:cell wall hydrolase [Sphingobium sp.]|uniref:cell wall hydrolase n=1 Tax=Sphingobium sp. TaxID=1912891 RepID=UPI002CBFD0A5|nr:cell wall hydrolase [Sphingobium sp.]HUD95363.1 cell wall hydrolase [Sphingobium sp.]